MCIRDSKGSGMGHGIGMCQVGAISMAGAANGYTYDRILSHYFPGTAVSSLSSLGIAYAASAVPAQAEAASGKREDDQINFQVRVTEPTL